MNDKGLVIICLTIIASILLFKISFVLPNELSKDSFYILSNIISGLLGIATGHSLSSYSKTSDSKFFKFTKKDEKQDNN